MATQIAVEAAMPTAPAPASVQPAAMVRSVPNSKYASPIPMRRVTAAAVAAPTTAVDRAGLSVVTASCVPTSKCVMTDSPMPAALATPTAADPVRARSVEIASSVLSLRRAMMALRMHAGAAMRTVVRLV